MELSIIIPFSNAGPYIRACARALHAQLDRVGDAEVIFADAASTDGSAELLGAAFPGVRVVKCPVRNPYVARNLAARAARGRVLVFTDADCAAGPQWLASVRDAFVPGVAFATGPVEPPGDVSRLLKQVHEYENRRMEAMCERGRGAIHYAYTNNFAVLADAFHALGGFKEDSERGGDSDFILRALASDIPGSMVYDRAMAVTHLEIRSITQWWRKKFLYGRSATGCAPRPSIQALGPVAGSRSAGLILALLAGRLCFSMGRLAGTVRAS